MDFLQFCVIAVAVIVIVRMGWKKLQDASDSAQKIASDIAKEQKQREEKIKKLKREFEESINQFKVQETGITKELIYFFTQTGDIKSSYETKHKSLDVKVARMKTMRSHLRNINRELVVHSQEDQSAAIEQVEKRVAIEEAELLLERFKAFGERVTSVLPREGTLIMDSTCYGKNNKEFWDAVCSMHREEAISYISHCERLLGSSNFDELFNIDIEKVLKCVWFFANEKPFSKSDFEKAKFVFSRIYKDEHFDLVIAELYAKNKMGGEDSLGSELNELWKREHYFSYSVKYNHLASSLMWMKAYKSEHEVLRRMLSKGMEMSAKEQERLHSLSNGGGNAPRGFEVQLSDEVVYFDISALTWKEDEYIGMFENLAFQDKLLTYSLAIREENKDLFLPHGIEIPGTNDLLNKFSEVFEEEYGDEVIASAANCIALSGSGEEKLNGILITVNNFKQLGILIHMAKIGKKLIIKFYTLFIPSVADLGVQKQQALSMYNKLSPTLAMWENSLKDTMLMAIEQLLNSSSASSEDHSSDSSSEVPVF